MGKNTQELEKSQLNSKGIGADVVKVITAICSRIWEANTWPERRKQSVPLQCQRTDCSNNSSNLKNHSKQIAKLHQPQ